MYTESECILWMEPDGEPPVLCRMKTIQDSGRNGIQYIKIDKSGSYYIYSQVWAVGLQRMFN